MRYSKSKKNLILTFCFLIGLIGLKSHPSIIFITLVFLFFNLLKAIQEYNQTKMEAEKIAIVLKKNWSKKRDKKSFI